MRFCHETKEQEGKNRQMNQSFNTEQINTKRSHTNDRIGSETKLRNQIKSMSEHKGMLCEIKVNGTSSTFHAGKHCVVRRNL